MKITVNNISIENTEQGYPYWFEISDGDKTISFTNRDARAICDALNNCTKEVETKEEVDK